MSSVFLMNELLLWLGYQKCLSSPGSHNRNKIFKMRALNKNYLPDNQKANGEMAPLHEADRGPIPTNVYFSPLKNK